MMYKGVVNPRQTVARPRTPTRCRGPVRSASGSPPGARPASRCGGCRTPRRRSACAAPSALRSPARQGVVGPARQTSACRSTN